MRLRRTLAGFAIPLVGAMTLGGAIATAVLPATPAAAATNGRYGGSAAADLVFLDAVDLGGSLGSLANAKVAPSTTAVDSAGLPATAHFPAGPNSEARATNLDAAVLSIALQNLLTVAAQSAPPDNPELTVTGLDLPLDPLLHATASRETVRARWLGADVCVPPGEPIARATSFLASATVLALPGVANSGVVTTTDAGTTSTVTLQNLAGLTNSAIQSQTAINTTGPIALFAGTPLEISVRIIETPSLTATATGVPGNANNGVKFAGKIGITLLGQSEQILDLAQVNSQIGIPGVLTIDVGLLKNVQVAADGTSASGDGTLLEVKLLSVTDLLNPNPNSPLGGLLGGLLTPLSSALQPVAGAVTGGVLDLALGSSTTSAFVPAGGVNCNPDNPLRDTHKTFSRDLPTPGSRFDYNIVIPNRGTCTLTNVTASDTVTGPTGTTIVGTSPAAATTNGLTTTFNLPDIPAGQTANVTITVQIPANAPVGAVYRNDVNVNANCNGRGVSQPAFVVGPTVGQGILPRTGGTPVSPVEGLALLAGAGAVATLVRRSRKATPAAS